MDAIHKQFLRVNIRKHELMLETDMPAAERKEAKAMLKQYQDELAGGPDNGKAKAVKNVKQSKKKKNG